MYQTKTRLEKAIGTIKLLINKTPSEIDRVLKLYDIKKEEIMLSEICARDIESSDGLIRYEYIPENADLSDSELFVDLSLDFESSDGMLRHNPDIIAKGKNNYAFWIK